MRGVPGGVNPLMEYNLAQNGPATQINLLPQSLPTGEVAVSTTSVVWSDWLSGSPQLYIRPQ